MSKFESVGVLRSIANIFNLVSSNSFNLLDVVDNANEVERQAIAQKLYDYYNGDVDAVAGHLTQTLGRTFTQDSIKEFQLLYLPLLRRIIEKIAIVYKGETSRYLSTDEATQRLRDLYQLANIDSKSKHWYRMGKLFHTVLVQPVVREKGGEKRLEFDIWTPNKITVVESETNYLEPAKIMYQVDVRKADGDIETETVYWSKEEHFRVDEHGNKIVDEGNPDGKNPYGVIPFVVLRFGEPENFWGTGETLLANIEEKVDVLLVQLMDLLIMQGHGQAVLKNAQVEGNILTGPKHPLILTPQNPDSDADFYFATVTGKVSEITSAIDWLINKTAVMYGLSQSSEQGKSQVSSGYAKMLDNWDIIEKREEDCAVLSEFEGRLFDVVKAVVEYEGVESFGESSDFYVEFSDYTFPTDPKVDIETKKMKMDLGLWSPVDDLMKEDSTLTREEALDIIEENLTTRNRIRDEFGMTDSLNKKEEDGLPGEQGGI